MVRHIQTRDENGKINKIVFSVYVGIGNYKDQNGEKHKFEIHKSHNDLGMYIVIDGEYYALDLEAFANAAINMHNERKKDKTKGKINE